MHKWVISFCLLWTAANAGPAYRWVDESGHVHYSDRPAPGAERVELVTGPTAAPSGLHSVPPNPTEPDRQGLRDVVYQSFAVARPAPRETLWGSGGVVDVALLISPELQPGHRLGYYLDGEFTLTDSRRMHFQLQDIHRGMHTLQAVILDEHHEPVLRSPAVAFYVQQTSIYYPRNPIGNRSGG